MTTAEKTKPNAKPPRAKKAVKQAAEEPKPKAEPQEQTPEGTPEEGDVEVARAPGASGVPGEAEGEPAQAEVTGGNPEDDLVELDAIGEQWVIALRRAKQRIEELENTSELGHFRDMKALAELRLAEIIGAHGGAKVGGKPVVTYKTYRPRKVFKIEWFREVYPDLDLEPFFADANASRPFRLLDHDDEG